MHNISIQTIDNSDQHINNSEKLGEFIKTLRKELKIKQKDVALSSNTGLRFIGDLEKGKSTCQIGKVLAVLRTLGVKIQLIPPSISQNKTAAKIHE